MTEAEDLAEGEKAESRACLALSLDLNQDKFEKFPAKSISLSCHNLKSVMYFWQRRVL